MDLPVTSRLARCETSRFGRVVGCGVVAAALLSACAFEERSVPVGPPCSRGTVFRAYGASTVRLEVASTRSLGEAVDLSAFEGLHPGVTKEEAVGILGPPTRVEKDVFGEDWFVW